MSAPTPGSLLRSRDLPVDLALGVVGFIVGGAIALFLPLFVWPGPKLPFVIVYEPPSPDEVRRAELIYGAVLGALGAVIPQAGFRIGFVVAALAVCLVPYGDYWRTNDLALPLLVGVLAWCAVGALIELARRFLRPDERRAG